MDANISFTLLSQREGLIHLSGRPLSSFMSALQYRPSHTLHHPESDLVCKAARRKNVCLCAFVCMLVCVCVCVIVCTV